MIDFRTVALRNAGRGFRVLPLHPHIPELDKEANQRCKRAIPVGWPSLATADTAQIERWAYQYPGGNVGVMADEQTCILESDNLPVLASRLGYEIPECYTVQARENRPHFYFTQTDATRALGNRDLPGIFEFKQYHKYCVAEGSISPYGPTYRLLRDLPRYPMPDKLVADLTRLLPVRVESKSDGVARPVAVERFVNRFSAYCERVGVAVTNVRTLHNGKVLIDTEPCLLHVDHPGAVGVTADGVRCVQCFHARCSIGWAKWRRAVEAKFKVPMHLEDEVLIRGKFKRKP